MHLPSKKSFTVKLFLVVILYVFCAKKRHCIDLFKILWYNFNIKYPCFSNQRFVIYRRVQYEKVGIPIKDIVICGGIALKNPFMMQIYADVLGKPIRVSRCTQATALGSAIYAAAAAGLGNVYQMTERMGYTEYLHYAPDPTTQSRYEHLYSEYLLLHDYFGRGKNPVMEYLSQIRK